MMLITLTCSVTGHASRASEDYFAYKITKETQQIYGSYLLNFKGRISESHSELSDDFSVLKEQFLPVEFIRCLNELSDIESFTIELGFGNWNILKSVPQIDHYLPHAGTTLRVKTENESSYLKLVKMLSGFMNTEIERPSTQFWKMKGLDGSDVFYHNSGSNSLNYNMFRKILTLINYHKTFTMISLANYIATFESDYVSFVLSFEKVNGLFGIEFEVNMIFREFIIERLFSKTGSIGLKKLEHSTFSNPEPVNLKSLDSVDQLVFKNFIKRSRPVYTLQGRENAPRNLLVTELHLSRPFTALRNEMVFDFQNVDHKNRIEFIVNIIFTPAEMPILSQFSLETFSGSFDLQAKSLRKFFEEINHSPGHLLTLKGTLSVGGRVRVKIPYQQVHRNFETINSEHVINYVVPAATITYRRLSENAEESKIFVRNFNNIAYKAKNYDTTVVFAVISVYLVILFFVFNSITKIKEDEKTK